MRPQLLIFLTIFFLGSCGEQSSNLVELETQNARNELCGVELFKVRESRQCGKIYKKKRSRHCGVEKYKKKTSLNCPGSWSGHEYGISRYGDCKGNYTKVRRSRDYQVERESGVRGTRTEHWYVCVRPEKKNTCRLKRFGVESYKSCRHSEHGIESYKTCRRPEHGVERYKQCEFYKTPDQALAYADLVEGDIPMMRDHMLTHKGNFYALQNSEIAMACHIKEYESSVLAKDVIASLKTKFGATFGRPYTATDYDCLTEADPIETANCPEGDTSAVCRSLYGYQTTVKWFEETNNDLTLIIQDLTKFGRKKIVDALMTVAQFLKDPHSEQAADAGAEQE